MYCYQYVGKEDKVCLSREELANMGGVQRDTAVFS